MEVISADSIILSICVVIILLCVSNNLLVCSHSPTLFDEVARWPFSLLKKIALVYILLTISPLITYTGVLIYTTTFRNVMVILKEDPHRYVFWNYIFLEAVLILIDKARSFNMQITKKLSYFAWCLMFVPIICLFEPKTITYSFKITLLILFTSTIVVYFWSVQYQNYIIRRFVFVMIVVYIFLTSFSILFIIFGFPYNRFGFILICFVLHIGLLFYILLFIFSTHVFISFTREGTDDFIRNVIDMYVCAMHIFGRIMVLNTYNIYYEL